MHFSPRHDELLRFHVNERLLAFGQLILQQFFYVLHLLSFELSNNHDLDKIQ